MQQAMPDGIGLLRLLNSDEDTYMAFPSTVTDIIATSIENRSKKISDNVLKNNALLMKLEMRGNVKTISGGSSIIEELSFAENGNGGWYSGYDLLPVAAQDVISGSTWTMSQLAVPVVISGLEQLQNSGKEQMIDLLESRLQVAESTMSNLLSVGLYSDGTAAGGKQIDGLDNIVTAAAATGRVATGTTGGIARTNAFWQHYVYDFSASTGGNATAANIQAGMNALWAQLVRGSDRPDCIMFDSNYWALYIASLQSLQRFTGTETAKLGFASVKYMDADVYLDGGIGGGATANTGYFLNSKYLKLRPHKNRNMVALNPGKRYAINQDAEVQILGWAGALTCSGLQFQGRMSN
jgi:hypothetical protein